MPPPPPFTCRWWWWTIGVPITLGVTTTILNDHLQPNQTLAAVGQLELAKTSGQIACNLVWTCEGTIYRGLLQQNATLVSEALNLSYATIVYSPGGAEGIKEDASFFEHGNQLYSGGYGMSYVQGIAMMLSWTSGTPFGLAPTDPRVVAFSHLALDGSQRMMSFGQPPAGSGWGVALWDVSVIGRDISRPYASNWGMQSGLQVQGAGIMPQGYGLMPVLMAGVGGARAAEFETFGALLNGSATPAQGAAALLGNRVYSIADYASHASPAGTYAATPVAPGVGWKATVRMASTRTAKCECGNGENLRGLHLSDGAIHLYITGYEYVDAFPVWDWMRVPGTTVLPYATAWTCGGVGSTAFVGGASDGIVGSAVMDVSVEAEGLTMRRSVFFFDDLYVVLGANITAKRPDLPAWTNIAQRRLSDTGVFTSDGGSSTPLPAGSNVTLSPSAWWVWEGGMGVVLPPVPGPPRAPLRVSNLVVTGDWATIGAESGNITTGLLTLTLEQPAPVVSASFAYIVVPNIGLSDFLVAAAALVAPGGLVTVRNDAGAQAVLHGPAQIMQAAVFELDAGAMPPSAALSAGVTGWNAAVSSTGAYIVSAAKAGSLAFTAASPSQGGAWSAALSIDRNVQYSGGGTVGCGHSGSSPWVVTMPSPPGNGTSLTGVCALA